MIPGLHAEPPVPMHPGDALISSISVEQVGDLPAPLRPGDKSLSPVRTVSVLTCLDKPVPADAFRPSYCRKPRGPGEPAQTPSVYLAEPPMEPAAPARPPEAQPESRGVYGAFLSLVLHRDRSAGPRKMGGDVPASLARRLLLRLRRTHRIHAGLWPRARPSGRDIYAAADAGFPQAAEGAAARQRGAAWHRPLGNSGSRLPRMASAWRSRQRPEVAHRLRRSHAG